MENFFPNDRRPQILSYHFHNHPFNLAEIGGKSLHFCSVPPDPLYPMSLLASSQSSFLPPPEALLQKLSSARVVVLGDIILDRYIHGSADRMSPEAPVPVVTLRHENLIPGGAANVAVNLATIGTRTHLIGMIGEDRQAEELLDLLHPQRQLTVHAVRCQDRPTITKTRIMAQGQQMLRIDRENSSPASRDTEEQILIQLKASLPESGALILSDYGKGTLTDFVLTESFHLANQLGIPTFVDPKGRIYDKYRGCWCLTPNAKEAADATGHPTNTPEGLLRAAEDLRKQTGAHLVVITRGADGVAFFEQGQEPVLMATLAREVYDVTGAGDTFIGFLALGRAAQLGTGASATLANRAAGIVVGKVGAASVLPAELRAAFEKDRGLRADSKVETKLVPETQLEVLGDSLRNQGLRVGLANGCFDFVHSGTVALLDQARSMVDVLVVATNNDEGIRRLKGPERPVLRLSERLACLAAISAVDYIVVYDQDTPHGVISALKPDILVKGAILRPDQVEGRELVESYGGKVVLLTTPTDGN